MQLDWHPINGAWELRDGERVLERLTHDAEHGYIDSRGMRLSKRWDDARAKAEDRARKVKA